jgi:protein-disulfide isomerase
MTCARLGLALLFISCALALSCSAQRDAGETTAADSPVVARIGDESVTQQELDDWIRDRLFEQEVSSKSSADQFEVRSRALEEMLSRKVVEEEAARRGISAEELVQQEAEALGPVGDEQVNEFFERHRARFRPEDTLERLGPRIRSFLESERNSKAVAALREKAGVEISMEPPRVKVAAEGPSRGPDTAPVTIVEFSDYQCPYCGRAEPVIREVLQRYPEKVRLVYRHLPLDSIHPMARGAAEASVCAEEQGHFWEFHDLLFANQRELEKDALSKYAKEAGLDVSAFEACLSKPEVKQRVQGDVDAAESLGIRGTPAFFVNGIQLSGAKPVEEFVRVIDEELARSEGSASTESGAS